MNADANLAVMPRSIRRLLAGLVHYPDTTTWPAALEAVMADDPVITYCLAKEAGWHYYCMANESGHTAERLIHGVGHKKAYQRALQAASSAFIRDDGDVLMTLKKSVEP